MSRALILSTDLQRWPEDEPHQSRSNRRPYDLQIQHDKWDQQDHQLRVVMRNS
jgi:hypothetical protein